jgi:hypothetical protein
MYGETNGRITETRFFRHCLKNCPQSMGVDSAEHKSRQRRYSHLSLAG